ncbi:hypothetical protein [Nocardia sp. NPDC020380]|uniref:hypothetical protein n=1 Tax=Nocardia sp. NPDC020380 TaxID=3364309 RepID=UPI0037906F7C
MKEQVNGRDVALFFGSSGKAKRRLQQWRTLQGREYVAEKVLAHVSSSLYRVEPEEVRTLDTEHPLGVLRENFEDTVHLIRDWRPDFAFSHLFHFCLEDLGRLFSWQEFRDEWSAAPSRRDWLWNPARQKQSEAASYLVDRKGYGEKQALAAVHDALQWRIGAFYYSFLREVYTLGWLRRAGLEVFGHPLADALFRADLWCGTAVVGIYIENPNYRRGRQGRKHPAQFYLGDQSQFSFVDLQMAAPGHFGSVALPTDDEMKRCGNSLRLALRP